MRAEIASASEPDEARAWLAEGAQQARRDGDFLLARMIEVAQLAMLVRADQHREAGQLARHLVPDLLVAGMTPQAWMSLRHVAVLLAGLGEYETAEAILDSAAASPRASKLVGEAIQEEADLRHRIQGELGPPSEGGTRLRARMSAGELWAEVEQALLRHEYRQ